MSDPDRACRAMAEVATPDGVLRSIACGVTRRRHKRFHANRQVRWKGRYQYAENIGEASDRLLRSVFPAPTEDKA